MNTPESSYSPDTHATRPRPLSFWLRVTERAISHEFDAVFAGAGITRRDWRLLTALATSGDSPEGDSPEGSPEGDVGGERAGRAARMAKRVTEHIARKPHSVRTLADLGWIVEQDGLWAVTAQGLAARAELAEAVCAIRARITGAVGAEDLATTVASLEAIAREFGWDGSQPGPHRGGQRPSGRDERDGLRPFAHEDGRGAHRSEFGPNLHHGFGPGSGPRPR